MNLEQAIDHAAEHLPDGWEIRISIERGAGYAEAIRPDFSEVGMDTGDLDLAEQVLEAVRLAHDESAADELSPENTPAHQPR